MKFKGEKDGMFIFEDSVVINHDPSERWPVTIDYADMEARMMHHIMQNNQSPQLEAFKRDWDDQLKSSPNIYKTPIVSFKHGDQVIYNKKHPATVISTCSNGNVKIKFNDPDNIPNIMEIAVNALHFIQRSNSAVRDRRFIDTAQWCPNCDVRWKETPGFRFSYWDCPQCGMKKEDANG